MFRRTNLMINILFIISFMMPSRIFTNEAVIPEICLGDTKESNCSYVDNGDQVSGIYDELSVVKWKFSYDEYKRLRREDKKFNEKLGQNIELFDILVKYQNAIDEYTNKLKEVQDYLNKSSNVYFNTDVLINVIDFLYKIIISRYSTV